MREGKHHGGLEEDGVSQAHRFPEVRVLKLPQVRRSIEVLQGWEEK
jgi:hypothetical protein